MKNPTWWNANRGQPWQSRLPYLYQKYSVGPFVSAYFNARNLTGIEWGVRYDAWEGGLFTGIESTRPFGGVIDDRGSWLALSGANTGAIIAANRLRARNIPVFWVTKPFSWRDRTFPDRNSRYPTRSFVAGSTLHYRSITESNQKLASGSEGISPFFSRTRPS